MTNSSLTVDEMRGLATASSISWQATLLVSSLCAGVAWAWLRRPDLRHRRPPWPVLRHPPPWLALHRLRQWRGRPHLRSIRLPHHSVRPWRRVPHRISLRRRARPHRVSQGHGPSSADPTSIVVRVRRRSIRP